MLCKYPAGGGGGGGNRFDPFEGYGFQAVYSGIGYLSQRVWVYNRVSFSRKLINWLRILVLTKETGNCHSKINYKNIKSVLF